MISYTIIKNTIFATLIVLVILLVIVIIPSNNESNFEVTENLGELEECIRVVEETELQFGGCYDAFSKKIFFEIKNSQFYDTQAALKVSFFDYAQRAVDVTLPLAQTSSFIKLDAGRNPLSIEIYLSSLNKNYCNLPFDLPISYCPANVSEGAQNNSINLVSSVDVEDFTEVTSQGSDIITESFVDPEKAWESICASEWDCEEWEMCLDGSQKRTCIDINNCPIPTNVPSKVKGCEETCIENWRCTWSGCSDGLTKPSCIDLNDCGTAFNKPQEIPCVENRCEPDIVCGDWEPCTTNYDFLSLQEKNINFAGTQQRTCVDRNSCAPDAIEKRSCSLEIDVYTRGFSKCGKEYVGIYDAEKNALLAHVEKTENFDVINVDLSGELSRFYCDYCFDGLLNGDEEQVDCGGSCASCSDRKVDPSYAQNPVEKLFSALFRWLR